SPAAILLAMYVAVAEKAGARRDQLGGTIQNDILKEYQAQKEFVFPPRPSMRIVTDMIRFCQAEMPRWHPVSISGYHIREAGSTAAQELAFTLANGFAYVEAVARTGLAVDDFAPRLSFFFNAHIDFFEEIAKYRAARRIWARWLKERYGAESPRSLQLRFHTQTAGVSLTAQQPELDILRTGPEVEERQLKRLAHVKAERDDAAVQDALRRVAADAGEADVNLMPAVLDAVRAYATAGEIVESLAGVFGRWHEDPVI